MGSADPVPPVVVAGSATTEHLGALARLPGKKTSDEACPRIRREEDDLSTSQVAVRVQESGP